MESKEQGVLGNVWVRLVLALGSVALFLAICGFLKGILISLFLAFTVAYVFDPVVDVIEARKKVFPHLRVRRALAIGMLLTGVVLVTVGVLTYAVPKTINGVQQVGNTLKERFPKYRLGIKELIDRYGSDDVSQFLNDKLGIDRDVSSLSADGTDVVAGRNAAAIGRDDKPDARKGAAAAKEASVSGGGADRAVSPLVNFRKYSPRVIKYASVIAKKIFKSTFGIFGIIINFFIFGVVTIYLLKDFDKITAKVRDLIPLSRRDKVGDIFSRIDVNLKEFFRGQITVCVILSFIYSIGLTAVGVPLSFILGFVAGFGNIIPYVGTIVGLVLTMVITFFQFHDIQHLLLVAAVFGVGQLLEGTLITPKVIGSKLGLSPVVVIVSILIWSQLLGFLGLLLAVPFTSAAKVLIDEGVEKYKKSSIYNRRA